MNPSCQSFRPLTPDDSVAQTCRMKQKQSQFLGAVSMS